MSTSGHTIAHLILVPQSHSYMDPLSINETQSPGYRLGRSAVSAGGVLGFTRIPYSSQSDSSRQAIPQFQYIRTRGKDER